MRIAILSRNFSVQGGGAERYAVAVAEQLAMQNEVHVFAQTWVNTLPNVHYHRIPTPLQRPRWVNQLYFAYASWRATRHGFDVVHSHEYSWHGNVQTVHVMPIKHNLFVGRTGWRLLLRWLKVLSSPRLLSYMWLEAMRYRLRPARRVVLCAHPLQNILQQTYPHCVSMLRTIAPGVSQVLGCASAEAQQRARRSLGLPMQARLLLLVGNDMRKKGLPTALQALEELPPDVHLMVVGQASHMDAMRLLARRCSGRVHFLGSLLDVGPAYLAADILLHPTLEDTYAMVVLEACAHGLPVIVSGPAFCGIAADLRNGYHALLLADPLDASALAAQVRSVLNDPALARRISANGLEFARNRTWQAVGQAHLLLYQDILNER